MTRRSDRLTFRAIEEVEPLVSPTHWQEIEHEVMALRSELDRLRRERDEARDRYQLLSLLSVELQRPALFQADDGPPWRLPEKVKTRLADLLDRLSKLLGLEVAALVMIPPHTQSPELVVPQTLVTGQRSRLERYSRGVMRTVWEQGQALSRQEALSDEELSGRESVKSLKREVLCLPLSPAPRGLPGVLWLERAAEEPEESARVPWPQADRALASTFAQSVAARALWLQQQRSVGVEKPDPTLPFRRNGAYSSFLSRSAAVAQVFSFADAFVRSDRRFPILIQGPSGSGKEVLARCLHTHPDNPDRSGPFLTFSGTDLTPELMQSQLFGYKKGAFAGAHQDTKGLLVQAEGGTLFIDEVGALSLPLQATLLRVLQEREVRPLGSHQVIPIDVRVILATRQPLREWVKQGRFREDLWYRISALELLLPSLSQRPEDLVLLAEHFIRKYQSSPPRDGGGTAVNAAPSLQLSATDMMYLLQRPWPGEVRELENVIGRVMVLAQGPFLDLALHAPLTADPKDQPLQVVEPVHKSLEQADAQFQRVLILNVLEQVHGNAREAARQLNVSLPTFYRRLRELGIRREKSA